MQHCTGLGRHHAGDNITASFSFLPNVGDTGTQISYTLDNNRKTLTQNLRQTIYNGDTKKHILAIPFNR